MKPLLIVLAPLVLAAVVVPFWASGYTINILTQVFLFGFLASAWNLMALAGLVSLGHAAFFGVGGYTMVWMYITLGLNPILGALVGASLAIFLAYIVFWITFRCGLRGIYFSGLTLVLAEGLRFAAINSSVLGRSQGLELIGLNLPTFLLYGLSLALMASALGLTWWLLRSAIGYRLQAVRENELAAGTLGVNTFGTKLTATLISAGLVAIGGSVHALLLRFVEPESDFGLAVSLNLLLGTFLGGSGTVLGPPVGIAVLFGLREGIAQIGELVALGSSGIYALQQIAYGLILMFIVFFLPEGLVNRFGRLARRWWPTAVVGEAPSDLAPELLATPRPALQQADGPFLEVVNVSRSFKGLAALTEVGFSLQKGEILGLIGPNGAGKTTLFNVISGIHPPSSGVVRFRGSVLSSLRPHKVCQHGIARTFQITQPFTSLTVIENALIGALSKHRDMAKAREVSLAALARVGLHHKSNQPAGSLTLQDRKMLEFARALATEPIVIMLDEVMAGLDPKDQAYVAEKIRSIRDSGITIVLIEHVMRAVMGLSDRIIVLDHGMVIAEGTPQEVAKHPEVIRVYLGRSVETLAT